MKLLKYVVVDDTGLAPNPFGKWCTLAVCTPNHKNAQLEAGDWIVGHSTKKTGNKLIYAMKVSEKLDFQKYFHDSRFQYKKPKLRGEWWEYTGDNMYCLRNGKWKQLPNPYHADEKNYNKDVKNHIVFIARKYYYLGENADEKFSFLFPELIKKEQGISYIRSEESIKCFIQWLKRNFRMGRTGDPIYLRKKPRCFKNPPKKPKC